VIAMRVLICRSNPILPDPRVEKEAAALSAAGYNVHALGWDRTAKLPQEEQAGSFRIHRLPLRAPFGTGLMNLPNLLRWQASLSGWLARQRHEFDLIHACDFDTILPALVCKRRWGVKVIYDIFDFYADHLRRTPPLLKNLIRRVDLYAIGQADALILVDEARRQQVAGSHPKRVEIIYNSPQDVYDQYQTGAPPASQEGLRLAYIGLLQVERGLMEMLDVLKRHPDWSLDLAGFGGDEERILAAARSMANVNWHGRIPYDRTLALSAQADLLFATYDPAIPNHRLSSPNKLFEAMMLGKPIVVACHTGMDHIVEQAGCGVVIEYGDIPALENTLDRLHRDVSLRCTMGARARQAYQATYSWSQMQARLVGLYREVCSPAPTLGRP
jgi:glycosyltransferase involved in cell wall biosynthesis